MNREPPRLLRKKMPESAYSDAGASIMQDADYPVKFNLTKKNRARKSKKPKK